MMRGSSRTGHPKVLSVFRARNRIASRHTRKKLMSFVHESSIVLTSPADMMFRPKKKQAPKRTEITAIFLLRIVSFVTFHLFLFCHILCFFPLQLRGARSGAKFAAAITTIFVVTTSFVASGHDEVLIIAKFEFALECGFRISNFF